MPQCQDQVLKHNTNATTEIIWIQTLLKELKIKNTKPTQLFFNNMRAKYSSSSLMFRVKTKHIVVDYHFVREMVIKKVLISDFVTVGDRVAYDFIEALSVR